LYGAERLAAGHRFDGKTPAAISRQIDPIRAPESGTIDPDQGKGLHDVLFWYIG
jgi:hypothetical protein